MKINAVSNYSFYGARKYNNSKSIKPENNQSIGSFSDAGLNALALAGYVSFKASQNSVKPDYEINLSIKELLKRSSSKNLSDYKMLEIGAPQYETLQKGDKETLKHLVKAARILSSVYLRQDNEHNIAFQNYLEQEVKKGNEGAKMALKLFNAQKGIVAKDINADTVCLAKKHPGTPGRGFFPEDLTKEEFHQILIKMLKDGHTNEVKKILDQRSIVLREGEILKAVDYTDYFKEEFVQAAEELLEAAKTSTNDDFTRFLILQADALLMNEPRVDAAADKLWAKLQDTPLEFTITRESYDDRMTPSVAENQELKKMLDEAGIVPYAKDNIGVRVGIVNKDKTDYLLKIKEFMPLMAENMPFNNEYEQAVSSNDNKQTMVDVDIVDMQGQIGAYRGSVSLASNLPNNDKLAVQTGGGKRNVYHIQTRNAKYENNVQEKMNALLEPSFHKYFDVEALHDFTILHENVHSLGPKNGLEKLGVYKNIIEENKADMGALVMLDVLTKKGFYTPLQQKNTLTRMQCGLKVLKNCQKTLETQTLW